MTPERRRLLLTLIAAVLATAGILAYLAPGRSDLPSREVTGMEAPDDGYWTSPLRRLAGQGDQDEFDENLALSLALPENALGALAWELGVPAKDARFAGSALALFATIASALWLGGPVAIALLLALLLAAPILGHFRSDLGEGTAFGIVSLFGLAIARKRIRLAAFLAAIGLFQKACGWPLGVGVLAAVLIGSGRAGRWKDAAIGTAAGVALCAALAALVFGDDPIAFVVRPFVATGQAGAGIDVKSFLVRAAFPCAFDVGPRLFLAAALIWVLLPTHRVRTPLVVAFLAGSAFAALFPDPWRVLPFWCLVPALLGAPGIDDPGIETRVARRMLSLYAIAQILAAWLAYFTAALTSGEISLPPRVLVWVGLAAIALDIGFAGMARTRFTTMGRWLRIALVANLGLLPISTTRIEVLRNGGVERSDFAARVAAHLPEDAHLIAHSFLAASFRGTLYYPPFQPLWERELDGPDAPVTIYRLRSETSTSSPPSAYAVESALPMGSVRYGRHPDPRPVVLETLRRK